MLKPFYRKPALFYSAQLQQLKDRGLHIESDTTALFLLENISYYRLSGYWFPMIQLPKSTHLFKPGSSFSLAHGLYCFDRELRILTATELEKIEVAIRAKMIYILSHHKNPFWYKEAGLFKNPQVLISTINKLTTEFDRSDEQFIKSFKDNYSNPLPPSWMILEISSFGVLSSLYKNLISCHSKREISRYFGLDNSTFESWLHTIVYIRNVCAHHSRLWNRVMRISPSIPVHPNNAWLSVVNNINPENGRVSAINNKTYYILSMIIYLLGTINPDNTFKQKIFALLKKYPNVDPLAMGFTKDWRNEPIWILNT